MKTPRTLACLALLVVTAVATGAATPEVKPPTSPNPLAGRFKQVNERVDALYRYRGEIQAAPDPIANPFRPPGALAHPKATTAGEAGETVGSEPEPVSNLALLQQSVATLKVSGVLEVSGRSHLVINARPYKQGDVVQTQVQGVAVYLRVRDISKRSVTLVLNDAEMTLKF